MALMRVRYQGLSDVREMSKKDLASAGVHLDSGLQWKRNGSVIIKDPSEDLLDLLKNEGTFKVEEVDEKGQSLGSEPIIEHTKVDDTADTVVDGNTGQKSTKPGK
jgi:hypothetical protein